MESSFPLGRRNNYIKMLESVYLFALHTCIAELGLIVDKE